MDNFEPDINQSLSKFYSSIMKNIQVVLKSGLT